MGSLPLDQSEAMNFTTYLLENGPDDADSPIFIDADNPGRKLSWRQYESSVKRIAVGLQSIGVAELDCMAVVSRNDIYYYILGNGISATGAIFAPVSAFAKPTEMVRQLQAADARWVFAELEFLDDVVAAAEKIGIPQDHIIIFDAQVPALKRTSYRTFTQLLQSNESAYHPLSLNGNSPCDRFLTSGSTGFPKSAEISHAASLARSTTYKTRPNPGKFSDVKTLHFIDMHHISAWFMNVMTAFGKQTLYISRRTSAVEVVDTIGKFGITNVMLHPRIMEEIAGLMKSEVREREALRTLKYARVGGSTVRGDSQDEFVKYLDPSASVQTSYGSTEASTMATLAVGTPRQFGYVGLPPKGIETIVVDPETHEEVPHDIDGEICCRGPTMFTGYVNNPEATRNAFIHNSTGTWQRTGDKGHFSSQHGQLAITGRYKDTFKVGTEEVAPEEVEVELLSHPAIHDVAVTYTDARPAKGGLEPFAYVVLKQQGNEVTGQEVVDFVAKRMAAHKAPTGGVAFCESIPRTSFGKVQRAKIHGQMEGKCSSAETFLNPMV